MIVATLINKLKKCPPDAEVVIEIPTHMNSLYEPRHTEYVAGAGAEEPAAGRVHIRTQRIEGS